MTYLPLQTFANIQVDRFKAHLRATALPLIDIHLYLSSENNYRTTHPAWTAILPWYANYLIPPRRRAAAKARTEHLGLSGLDIDYDVSSSQTKPFSTIEERYENAKTASLAGNAMARGGGGGSGSGIAGADAVPERTFPASAPRNSNVRDMLAGSGSTTLFKLDRMASACFRPLEELLGSNPFLILDKSVDSNRPSSLDCLALGYLSLIAFPNMRKAFLADVLRTRYAKLYAYVLRLQEVIFGKQMIDVRIVMLLKDKMLTCKTHQSMAPTSNDTDIDITLPWSLPIAQQAVYQTFKSTTLDIIHSIPLLNSILPHEADNITCYNPSQSPSLFSAFFPLTTAILTFFISYATYATLSEKADVNPHFRIERESEWRQRQWRRWHSNDYEYDDRYNNAGTAFNFMRHGLSGLYGSGGIGRNIVSAREERKWGRPNVTVGGIDDPITGDESEAKTAEVEADIKVEV